MQIQSAQDIEQRSVEMIEWNKMEERRYMYFKARRKKKKKKKNTKIHYLIYLT